MAFAQVVFNTIVATQNHRSYQAQHFLGFHIQRAFGIGGGIQCEKAFDIGIGRLHDAFVHPGAVSVEIVFQFPHNFRDKNAKKISKCKFNFIPLYCFNKCIPLLNIKIMESLAPNIFTNNIQETIALYTNMGFNVAMSVPEQGDELVWAMMVNGSVTIMFQTFDSLANELPEISRNDGGSLLLYINVKDIRGFFDRIKDKVKVLKGLEKTFYGATEFSILDNNNYVLTFAEHE